MNRDEAEIEAFAHLTTDEISGEVDRLAALDQGGYRYFLSTPSWKVHENSTLLYRFRREMSRREALTITEQKAA